jgi:hypothetical protein
MAFDQASTGCGRTASAPPRGRACGAASDWTILDVVHLPGV